MKNKKIIYQVSIFLILSFIIIRALYFKLHAPVSIVLFLEILLFIKLTMGILPITKFVEEKIVRYYPKYNNFNIWIKRLILFVFYLLIFVILYTILKFIIVNIIMMKLLNIPVQDQIYDFINKTYESINKTK
jgi:hypothetical protein